MSSSSIVDMPVQFMVPQSVPEISAAETRPIPAGSLLDQIGNTPLFLIRRIPPSEDISPNVQIFGKAEWFNPGGSVKDRPALAMVLDGEARGLLKPGKTILESTSGNTGIGLALIGAVKGYSVKLVMPENVSNERKSILSAYGAELIFTDPLEGSDGAILEARRIYEEDPDRYFKPDQYNNPANWLAHYRTTGVEIWQQTHHQITHFIAGLGTSGTLMGTGRRLKDYNPNIQIIAVEPADEFVVIEGLKHMETAIVPGIYDELFPDLNLGIFPEEADEMTKRLAQEEGLFVGISGGAALAAALKVAQDLENGVIVVLLPDGGEKYLSLGR